MLQPDPQMPGLMWDKPYPPSYRSPVLDCKIERWIICPWGLDRLLTSSLWEAEIQWVQSPSGTPHQRVLLMEFDQTLSSMQ
jgi:hypothetical protein